MSRTVLFFHVSSLLHIFLPASILAGIIGWIVYARCFHPLAKFPGPLLASVTRLWLICDVATGAAEKTQARLHEQYGKTPRVRAKGAKDGEEADIHLALLSA
jgi:hypothetical protein